MITSVLQIQFFSWCRQNAMHECVSLHVERIMTVTIKSVNLTIKCGYQNCELDYQMHQNCTIICQAIIIICYMKAVKYQQNENFVMSSL